MASPVGSVRIAARPHCGKRIRTGQISLPYLYREQLAAFWPIARNDGINHNFASIGQPIGCHFIATEYSPMSPQASIAKRLLIRTARGIVAGVLAIIVFQVIIAGLSLRRWAWDFTEPVRFAGDMERNFLYGSRAATEGYFNVYENVYVERDPGDYDIDYPPLRLLTFDLWIQYLKSHHHDVSGWDSSYEFNSPLLGFNTFTETASTIAVFLIIRRWTKRIRPGKKPRPGAFLVSDGQSNWESWSRAGLGALLVWFTPGALADGHGWATYDVWIPPF
jgi:hypothetical protein